MTCVTYAVGKMTLINIGDIHCDDQFYRYKMPSIEVKVEGRGNGIKTKLVNIETIAKALTRPTHVLMKYFAVSLGTSATSDVLRGKHDVTELTKVLSKYINQYVLCMQCTNPETLLKIRKDRIKTECKACGARYYLDDNTKHVDTVIKAMLQVKP
jgi:translation initiation factor 5